MADDGVLVGGSWLVNDSGEPIGPLGLQRQVDLAVGDALTAARRQWDVALQAGIRALQADAVVLHRLSVHHAHVPAVRVVLEGLYLQHVAAVDGLTRLDYQRPVLADARDALKDVPMPRKLEPPGVGLADLHAALLAARAAWWRQVERGGGFKRDGDPVVIAGWP